MWPNPQFPADLVTFTEDTLHGKLHFLCSVKAKLDGTLSHPDVTIHFVSSTFSLQKSFDVEI